MGMLEENRAEPPKTIGSLTANDEELTAYIFIPAERMADLAAVAQVVMAMLSQCHVFGFGTGAGSFGAS